jgi:hypothetical protein
MRTQGEWQLTRRVVHLETRCASDGRDLRGPSLAVARCRRDPACDEPAPGQRGFVQTEGGRSSLPRIRLAPTTRNAAVEPVSYSDIGTEQRDAEKATCLVRNLADQVRAMAGTDRADRPEIGRLAETLNSLADSALSAAEAIASCLIWARNSLDRSSAHHALIELETAQSWVVLLAGVVDTAVAVYAQACRLLADRVALAEEYRSARQESQPGLATAVLVATACELTAHRRTDQRDTRAISHIDQQPLPARVHIPSNDE